MTGVHRTGIALVFLLLALTVIPVAAGPTAPAGFGSGLGCAAQCIRTAVTTSHGKSVGLHITTDTPAKLKAQISTQAPLPNGNAPPWFTNPTTKSDNSFRTDWTTSFSNLEPDTTYHIVVRATDASGNTAYQQGTFRTLKRKVMVTFTRILVIGDADEGVNRGEISFDFFVNDQEVGGLGQQKIASGETIHFSRYALVDDAPEWLPVRVRGRECDAVAWNCPIESGEPFPTNGGGSWQDWDYAHASAFVNVDDAGANALPPIYGTDLPAGHDGYLIFETTGYHLKFRVYGYFDVDYVV
jgi:hypothetical protein